MPISDVLLIHRSQSLTIKQVSAADDQLWCLRNAALAWEAKGARWRRQPVFASTIWVQKVRFRYRELLILPRSSVLSAGASVEPQQWRDAACKRGQHLVRWVLLSGDLCYFDFN